MIALEAKNVCKSFGAIKALNNVSISISEGEIRAILGGNGSGKSTFSKILGGSVKLDSGEISLYGKEYKTVSPSSSKKQGVVVTSQELSLLDNLSVAENLLLCNLPVKSSILFDKKKCLKQAEEILEKLKIGNILKEKVDSLSANQKYMVEFAKALLQDPKILVIDEITSALHREEVNTVRDIAHELKKKGTTILFISHRMPEIFSICDSITVLRNGELVGTFGVKDNTEDELLSLMTGLDMKDFKQSIQTSCYVPTNDEPLLYAENFSITGFKNKINLEIQPGEIIGIAGLQGNGQSNLVRRLFAIDGPIELKIDGNEKVIKSPKDAIKNGIAFISGDREKESTFSGRSIAENLGVVADLVLKRKIQDKSQLLSKYSVVMNKISYPIKTLSGGNQQKIVMARWTSTEPRILLADDPTKGIDVQARREIHKIIRELTENGSSVIYVSSDDEELVELTSYCKSSKVIIMYNGEIVNTLTNENITSENIANYAIPRGAK